MVVQKDKNKKPGIYKCSGLTLLAILIILALLFHATWKVTALLLIVLAACTILPRPYRKWFWLSVAAVVVVLIIWVFLPEDNEGWRPYTFDEELAALEAKYAIPDSENAAIIYNRILKDHDPNEFWPDFLDFDSLRFTRQMPWSYNEYPELAKWIDGHKSVIADLIEVGKKEKCYFPRKFNYGDIESTANRLNTMRRWGFLLTTAANNDLGENLADEALEKYMAVLKMAEHLYQQPAMVDMLVGIAIESLALRGFKTFTVNGNATEQQLDIIEKAVSDVKHDWTSDWPGILEYEKLMVKNQFGEYYETDLRGSLRLSRDPKARIRARTRNALKELSKYPEVKVALRLWVNPNYWQRKLIRAKTIAYWFYLPSRPQKGAEIIDMLCQKYYKMADVDFDWKKEPEEILPRLRLNYTYLIENLVVYSSVGSSYSFHDIYLRVNADSRVSRLIVTLRRYKNEHGRWPESLDVIKELVPEEILVDPINGGSFVYKLNEDNFTIYSKGKNNIDDGGERDRQSGADDWPIWSPENHKTTKEEKANDEQR